MGACKIAVDSCVLLWQIAFMNLLGVRQHLQDMVEASGGAVGFIEKHGKEFGLRSHSHVSAVIRGAAKPGRKLLKVIGKRRVVNLKKPTVMKFEDI